MAANRYDQAAEMPILNTYVPIDFVNLYHIGAAQKAAMDQAIADIGEAIQTFGEFTSPSDIDTENYYNLSLGQMNDLITEASTDPDKLKDAGFRARFYGRLNNLNYAELSRLKQGAENLEMRNKVAAEMKAKGLYNENWDVYYDGNGNIIPFDASNYDTLRNGILDQLSPIQYKSMRDIIAPYVDDLKPTFIEGNVNPLTGRRLPFTKGYMAITQEHLNNILDRNINEILRTPQGQMWYRDIAQAISAVNPNATDADVMQAFKDNMYRDAAYKLIASPVEDEYAMKSALMREEAGYNTPTGPILGWNDILSQQHAASVKNTVATVEMTNPEFKAKYDGIFNSLNQQLSSYTEQAMSNSEFSNNFRQALTVAISRGMDPNDQSVLQTALQYATTKSKSLDKNFSKQFNRVLEEAIGTHNAMVDEATGRILQDIFNKKLAGPQNPYSPNSDTNPFENVLTTLDSGQPYYSESKVHEMYQDGLMAIAEPVSDVVQQEIKSQIFNEKDRINSELGYIFNPSGRLLSPKQVIANNKYISDLAEQADFDIKNTQLNRDSWSGDQNFDIEEQTAKGSFGNVAIGNVLGYIDTPEERGYVVTVNIPMKDVIKHYDTWWSTEGNIEDALGKTYQISSSPVGEDQKGSRWDGGYLTTIMLMPESNKQIDITQSNRLWQKNVGVNKTQQGQINQDDAYMQQLMGFKPGIGLGNQ